MRSEVNVQLAVRTPQVMRNGQDVNIQIGKRY